MAYIYKITNKINGKIYIGQTIQKPENRWKEHIKESTYERFKNRAIYRALRKYGINNFLFEVIEETEKPNEREKYYIEKYSSFGKNGYNETPGGSGRPKDYPEKEICNFYLSDNSLSKTGLKFNISRDTVKRILEKNNIDILKNGEYNKKYLTKKVAKIDKNTDEILQIYDSVRDAERDNGNSNHISDVCRGKRKTCQGYKWKYV